MEKLSFAPYSRNGNFECIGAKKMPWSFRNKGISFVKIANI